MLNHYDKTHMQAAVLQLYGGGPRMVFEFLVELAAAHAIEQQVLARLDDWRDGAPATTLQAVLDHFGGGKQFPPTLSPSP